MNCAFCGKELIRGSGKMYAKDNGTIFYFCSRKCEKNLLELKRDPRKFKWTTAFVKQAK